MRVIRMVADPLRYRAQEMHVDGFQFDLGTILARHPNGFDNQRGFHQAVTQDTVLGKLKLVAEPRDCGPAGTLALREIRVAESCHLSDRCLLLSELLTETT